MPAGRVAEISRARDTHVQHAPSADGEASYPNSRAHKHRRSASNRDAAQPETCWAFGARRAHGHGARERGGGLPILDLPCWVREPCYRPFNGLQRCVQKEASRGGCTSAGITKEGWWGPPAAGRVRADVKQALQHELPVGYIRSAAAGGDGTAENAIALALEQAPVPPKVPLWHG